jgi:FKBP-type peptidyl-prolyl cis-trans isomerase SlyD
MEDEDGTVFDGVAIEITDDFVIIDFNHPLAGEDLYFTGKIIKVEDAPVE